MEARIFDLILDDSRCISDPYGGLVIATENVWDITFCFNKRDMLDTISNHSLELDPKKLAQYECKISDSKLPEFNNRDVIVIDGSAAYHLAEALQSYSIACQAPYAPWSAWPWLDSIPKAGVGGLLSDLTIEDLEHPEDLQLFNILFSVSDGFQNIVYIVSSREQYNYLLDELAQVPFRKGTDLNKLFGHGLLPEVSCIPLMVISGSVADRICPAVAYVNYIQGLIHGFGNRFEQRMHAAENLN